MKAGRPRKHASNAAKQKAYRERQKARKAPPEPVPTPQIVQAAERHFKPDFK